MRDGRLGRSGDGRRAEHSAERVLLPDQAGELVDALLELGRLTDELLADAGAFLGACGRLLGDLLDLQNRFRNLFDPPRLFLAAQLCALEKGGVGGDDAPLQISDHKGVRHRVNGGESL